MTLCSLFTLLLAISETTNVASRKEYPRLRQSKSSKATKIAKASYVTDNTSDNSGSSSVLIDFAFVTTSPTGGPTSASLSTSQTNDTTDIMIQLDSATDDLMVGIATLPTAPASISVDEAIEDYVWSGGLCTSNKDCYSKMRESLPGSDVETIGVDICGCYADSRVDSFDECQGGKSCVMALCYEDSCRGRSAYCSESGLCMLHEQKNAQSDDSMLVEVVPSDVDLGVDEIDITEMSVPIMSSWCTFDTDCPSSFICIDKSNGNCFFPPCGRCETATGNANTELV